MADERKELMHPAEATPGMAAVHRRRFTKPDGRELFLYGYSPHEGATVGACLDGGPKEAALRWHPLRGEWSVYAAGRQNRTFRPTTAEDPLAPMVPGGPPTEIPFADFELAVFENRFPSFSLDAQEVPSPPGTGTAPAIGRCEVVVYTPEETGSLATLSQERRELLVRVWTDRYEALFGAGAAFVMPFENRGDAVGVTLPHPHGQIYAFPVIPKIQETSLAAFHNGQFNFAEKMSQWGDYVLTKMNSVVAFAPPFARFPYEVWIAPAERRAGPWEMTADEISGFAHLLGEVTRRYDNFFECETPFMLSLQAAPRGSEHVWHFWAQFFPLLRAKDKLKYLASVEQATGLFTVDVPPEETVRALRDR
ncbi:MAG: galactose-1-phosphate uridylyltransferase [Pseudomonadota bacterium]